MFVPLFLSVFLSAAPASPQQAAPPPPPPPPAPAEPSKAERKICKQVANTGTRMGKRVCLTKAQWDEMNGVGLNQGLNAGQMGRR